jgi:hypothetical protein
LKSSILREGEPMTDIDKKKLPTVEQVEFIIINWGKYTVEEFANRFHLEIDVIEATIQSIQNLKRSNNLQDMPAMSCFRNKTLDAIVRCAGSRHGYL